MIERAMYRMNGFYFTFSGIFLFPLSAQSFKFLHSDCASKCSKIIYFLSSCFVSFCTLVNYKKRVRSLSRSFHVFYSIKCIE